MAKLLRIVNSYPGLSFSRELGRKMPAQVKAQIAGLNDHDAARQFVESAGLNTLPGLKRITKTAFSVSLTPPSLLGAAEVTDINYHGPQVVLSRIDCVEIPLGTVLVNCLMPKIESLSEAEIFFGRFLNVINTLANRLRSNPFALITGLKYKSPQHELDQRGFRFFFSPEPDSTYQTILNILKLWKELYAAIDEERPRDEKINLADQVQTAKFCTTASGKMGHSILEDIKLAGPETHLVYFRPS
ncbi:MAG: hypothetical protein KKA31_02285 [Candidatus Margulisbacteria bacterium]|nr:hypothetical protein [Candidatus Margulisiibacteriota bacterium]